MGPSCMVTFDCSGLIWKRLKSLSIVLQDPSHNFEPQVIVELVIHLPLVYSGICLSLSLYIYMYIHVLQILQILHVLQIYHIYIYIHTLHYIPGTIPFHSIAYTNEGSSGSFQVAPIEASPGAWRPRTHQWIRRSWSRRWLNGDSRMNLWWLYADSMVNLEDFMGFRWRTWRFIDGDFVGFHGISCCFLWGFDEIEWDSIG